MFNRLRFADRPMGPPSPPGKMIHRDPQYRPPRHDLRKVRHLPDKDLDAKDPDLTVSISGTNRELSSEGQTGERLMLPRLRVRADGETRHAELITPVDDDGLRRPQQWDGQRPRPGQIHDIDSGVSPAVPGTRSGPSEADRQLIENVEAEPRLPRP